MNTLRRAINAITVFTAFCLCLGAFPTEAAAVLPNGLQDVYNIFTTGIGPKITGTPYDAYVKYNGAYASWSSPDFVLSYDGGPVGTDATGMGIMLEDDSFPPRGAWITHGNASTGTDGRMHWLKVSANNTSLGSFVLTGMNFENPDIDTYSVRIIGTKLAGGSIVVGPTSYIISAYDAGPTSPDLTAFAGQQITSFTIEFTCTSANLRPADFTFQNFTIASAMAPAPEVNIQGNSTSIADGDATPSFIDHTDFGTQSICSGTIVRTFTVQNTGNANLTISSINISGTNAADFSITASPSSPVSAAGSTTFQVTFNPSASGTRTATITVNNSDSDEGSYDFAIQGTGVNPEVNVTGNSNSIADGDATPSATDHTDFGSQSICSGTIVRTFTIQNTGNANLTLGTVTIGGTNAADFSVTANPSSPVSAAGSTTFQVTFNPSAAGTRSADISFTSDDCDEATYNFAIQGTGTDPEVNVQGNGNTIVDGDATPSSTDHTDFGLMAVASGTIVRTFTIQNTGTSNLTFGTVAIGGAQAADFSVTANPASPVSAAGSTSFQVTFNPSADGTRSADVSISTNDCDEATYNFTIHGTGITAPIADAPLNVTACDAYTLPALTVGNYFTGSGGTGTALSAGNMITSTQTIYVYAETGTTPNYIDENSFTVTINTTPVADDPADVTACDAYELLPLTVGNYFTGSGGTGTALSAGNIITSTQTIYVYAETGTAPNCTDENSFTVTINTTPVADDPADVTAWDAYELPALTVGNYFTGPGGTGTLLSAGNLITSTQTIYVYAETGTTPNCTDENSFVVDINITPPTTTAASGVSAHGFTANWNPVGGVTGYRLDVATNSDFTSFVSGFDNQDVGNVTSYPLTGLVGNTAYYYRVRGYNANGTSASSNIVNPTTFTGKVTDVVVAAAEPLKLYASFDGEGIYRSVDGGASWLPTTTPPGNRVMALAINPLNPATLFAASYGEGVYQSTDSGDTWSACTGQPGNLNAISLAIDPAGTLYAGTEGGIFTSVDCASWSAVNTGLTVDAAKPPVAIVIDPADSAKLYAGLDGAGVFWSSDSGAIWTAATTQPTNLAIKALAIDNADSTKLFAATYGGGVHLSTDSGSHWSACTNTNLTNLNLVSLTIASNGKLYAGSETGVFVSSDNCGSWTAMNAGLP